MKLQLNLTHIVIAIVAIFALLFFVRQCGAREQLAQYNAMKHQYDSLARLVDAGVQSKAQDHFRDSMQLIEARKQTTAAIEDKKASDKKLTAAQATVKRLSEQVLNSSWEQRFANKLDSAYGDTCKELAVEAQRLSSEVDRYRQQSDEAMNLLNYEVVLRDSVIEAEKTYSQNLLGSFRALQRVADEALKAAKPRGRFLAGAGILGNKTNLLTGVKIAMAYQTKGGKQYQAGAAIVNKELLYEGTVLITLFK